MSVSRIRVPPPPAQTALPDATSLTPPTDMEEAHRTEDFAGAAVFLASRASAYVTGQAIFVDGGFSVH
ncbi:SDR family oxidoreductase [Streptomyces sp. NPDC058279]|uniref:SDR family oxidoreductase n=1 Tax=Streptomyces sp. NPDC058279 TaxID=3346418 RepID=UPI0036ED376B